MSQVVEKKKGPAPPPPSLPNSNAATGPKESVDEKAVPEPTPIEDENEIKPNRKEMSESPTSTIPEEISSQPEVILLAK